MYIFKQYDFFTKWKYKITQNIKEVSWCMTNATGKATIQPKSRRNIENVFILLQLYKLYQFWESVKQKVKL